MTDGEKAEIVRGYLDMVLAAMDRVALVTFWAHYVTHFAATAAQPIILEIIDWHLRHAKARPPARRRKT